MSTVSLVNQIEQESVTFEGLDFFFEEDFKKYFTPSKPLFDLHIIDEKSAALEEISPFESIQPKKKLKGLFKGLKIEEEEIEEAKKSLFPEREF